MSNTSGSVSVTVQDEIILIGGGGCVQEHVILFEDMILRQTQTAHRDILTHRLTDFNWGRKHFTPFSSSSSFLNFFKKLSDLVTSCPTYFNQDMQKKALMSPPSLITVCQLCCSITAHFHECNICMNDHHHHGDIRRDLEFGNKKTSTSNLGQISVRLCD